MGITIEEIGLVSSRRDGQEGGSTGGGGRPGRNGTSGTSGSSGTSGESGMVGATYEPFYYSGGTLYVGAIDTDQITLSGYTGLDGINEYYVAATSGGSPTTKLTFVNGLLISDS